MSSNARQLELILTATGGAELVALGSGETLWASDTDEDFREEFPEVLDENDAEAVFDFLVDNDFCSDDEADEAEFSIETLDTPAGVDDPDEVIEGELVDD